MERQTGASRRLYEIAQAQGGFFATRQAREAGFSDSSHSYHVRSGNWIRERRGIYRLAQFPSRTRPDLIMWHLWSANRQGQPQGVFSHVTALALHELSDVMPASIEMTVPPGFQRMASIPEVLHLHRGRLSEHDIETFDGVRVTTPLRTLIDVIGDGVLAPEFLTQAVDQAIRRGLVMRQRLEMAKVSVRARQRIDRVLKQVPDDRSTPVRNRKRAPRGARSAAPRKGAS